MTTAPVTFTVTLTPLQMQALMAFSNITDPDPCFDHEDGKHGDYNECMGYAPEFEDAVWQAFDAIGRAYGAAAPKYHWIVRAVGYDSHEFGIDYPTLAAARAARDAYQINFPTTRYRIFRCNGAALALA